MSYPKQTKPEADEVLMQFAAEHDLPTPAQLQHYIGMFPQFKAELIEFAAALVEDRFHGEAVETAASEAAAQIAVSQFHNLRYEYAKRGLPLSSAKAHNPISRLSKTEFGQFVAKLKLPKEVVVKLRDRQIQFETIPVRLIDALASCLEVAKESVVTHLMARPQMARLTTSSLSTGTPRETRQETFEEALASAHLSPEEISQVKQRYSTEL
ncbi:MULTISPECIES: hypothetical protein [unclassified Caballeronia]|uniref:hypothetical protein n=1 Tax=unclassified Caballeronia TaxID=2646786 RepID=UPI00285D30EB|nr:MULTISPECIES: hypothetical protein [unclassified Caballeronia]MDR5751291.1 hypothetical protein [Caballeronia sp. LZ024]MDR5844571.1 hypothetical protein [Caballeronia sp. LZ031]